MENAISTITNAIKDIEGVIASKEAKNFAGYTRQDLIIEARAAGVKINGKAADKNNTKNDLVKALVDYRDNNIAELNTEKSNLEKLLEEEKAAAEPAQESEPETEEEQESAAEVGREIILDMIDGYYKLETPYLLKIVAPEKSSPSAVEIYQNGELIDTSATVKGARQKAAHLAPAYQLPEGYEARESADGKVYTAYFNGEPIKRRGGKDAIFNNKRQARYRCVAFIGNHFNKTQE